MPNVLAVNDKFLAGTIYAMERTLVKFDVVDTSLFDNVVDHSFATDFVENVFFFVSKDFFHDVFKVESIFAVEKDVVVIGGIEIELGIVGDIDGVIGSIDHLGDVGSFGVVYGFNEFGEVLLDVFEFMSIDGKLFVFFFQVFELVHEIVFLFLGTCADMAVDVATAFDLAMAKWTFFQLGGGICAMKMGYVFR